jgi:hypothetical protein
VRLPSKETPHPTRGDAGLRLGHPGAYQLFAGTSNVRMPEV